MRSAAIQFNWQRFPEQRLSFGFFFRPILWRLKPCYWVCSHWPLAFPISDDARIALQMIEHGVTPPDTVLPDLADQIFGDRDEFFGMLSHPTSAQEFESRLRDAGAQDTREQEAILLGRWSDRAAIAKYEQHVARNGTHMHRFFDAYPVEFAFCTNDTVWWIAARESSSIDELHAYAASVKGMSCRNSVAFGM